MRLKEAMGIVDKKTSPQKDKSQMPDWQYLIHHVHTNKDGKDEIHHCPLADHLGNLYEIEHVTDEKGRIIHAIQGLVKDQKVFWSDIDATVSDQKVPCANRQF